MGNVGLLLVGVVLLVNGLSSLGRVPARGAAPLNLFVGAAQIVLPTIILIQHGSDPAVLNATWPSYLFGITYLWFGLQTLYAIEPEGFGWYSAFVAGIAGYYAVTSWAADPVFAVIWATWASMWLLFFAIFALGRTTVAGVDIGRFTGWYLTLLGIPTCTVAALFLLNGVWTTERSAGFLALAGLALAAATTYVLARATGSADALGDAPVTVRDERADAREVVTAQA